jgi:hypothetical protein
LHVGNFWRFHTSGNPPGWSARITVESVDRVDTILGKAYYTVVGREFPDNNPADTSIFHCFWVREDSAGNILLAAYALQEVDIDSAIILDPPAPMFSNEFLTVGYYRDYTDTSTGTTYQDSVMSATETAISTAGTFTNCLKVREQQKDSSENVFFREYAFYARGVGEVKRTREIPINEAHENDLVEYSILTVVEDNFIASPNSFVLEQNYPNPFNPVTVIRYQLTVNSFVTLKVFDVLGQEVATLADGVQNAGYKSITWDASMISSGVYYYRLQANNYFETKKLLLLK